MGQNFFFFVMIHMKQFQFLGIKTEAGNFFILTYTCLGGNLINILLFSETSVGLIGRRPFVFFLFTQLKRIIAYKYKI